MQMAELQDSSDLQSYSTAVLYLLSAVNLPQEYVKVILDNFTQAIKSATVRDCLDNFHILSLTITYIHTVMADPSARLSGPDGLLLPKPDGYNGGGRGESNGCAS
jgi:hypothetical protein